MAAIGRFIKREPVLLAAALAALVSCIFVPPDAAYGEYIDFRTLALLYCLMTVVAGLRQAGLFDRMAHLLCRHAASMRILVLVLVLLSFFSAMLITNDVALLTFVPFAVVVLTMAGREKDLLRVVALQTAAANLGSMLTPVGNPQNLFLYSYYDLSLGAFLDMTLPVWVLSLALILALCLPLSGASIRISLGELPVLHRGAMWLHLGLFTVCLVVVARLMAWYVMMALVVAVLLFFDRKLLLKADFMLLLTFVAFFIFAGNLGRMEAVAALLRRLLDGREFPVTVAASQVISNVPAAVLLAPFTGHARALVLGVNVGGLGTPIASLASLISLKLYAGSRNARVGRYLLEFTAISVALLMILSLAVMFL